MLNFQSGGSGPPEGPALLLPPRLLFGSGGRRTRPASSFFISFVPFRDKSLMRSRMVHISDAPAVWVIGLRGVGQGVAQMKLLGGSRCRRGDTYAPQVSH